MKTKVFLFAVLSLVIIFTSCQKEDLYVSPSSKVTTTNFSATNIQELDVSDPFNVYVSFSETEESVQIEVNENLHQLIEISQSGNRLKIGLEDNSQISGYPVLNVYIRTATLVDIEAEGAAQVQLENSLQTSELEISVTGASSVNGNIEVNELITDLIGASKLNISGYADSFEIDAEGASAMTGFDFQCNSFEADLMGGCSVSATINQKLKVNATGASKVFYKGNGIIEDQNISDTSEIVKMN